MPLVKKISVALAAAICFSVAAAPASARLTAGEADLLRAVNQTRAQHGLVPLRLDATLVRAARYHTASMLRSGAFNHGDFARRLSSFGARGPRIGENLAWGTGSQGTSAAMIQGWLASPGHRANLLRPGFRRIGIGRRVGTFGGYGGAVVVTTDFAGR